MNFPTIEMPVTPNLPAVQAASLKTAALAHFSALEAPLRALAERYRAVAFDLSTPKGLDAAKKARNDLRENGRYAVQRAEDAFKAAANEAKKAVAPKVEELIAIIKPVEENVDAQIKRREAEIEQERQRKEAAERERIAGHEARLATLRGYVAQAAGRTAAQIAAAITALDAIVIGDSWQEFFDRADAAKLETMAALRALHEKTQAAEALAAEQERQRIENARVAAEQAVEAKRLKDAANALEAERAELKRQQDEMASAMRAAAAADAPVATQAPDEPEQPASEPEKPLYAPLRAEQEAVREFAFGDAPAQVAPDATRMTASEVETRFNEGISAMSAELTLASREPIIVAESRRYRYLRDCPAEVLLRFVHLPSKQWDAEVDALMSKGVR